MPLIRDIERLRARCKQRRRTLTVTLAALARQRETLAARLHTLVEQQQAIARRTTPPCGRASAVCRALMLHQQRLTALREESRRLADRQRQMEQARWISRSVRRLAKGACGRGSGKSTMAGSSGSDTPIG